MLLVLVMQKWLHVAQCIPELVRQSEVHWAVFSVLFSVADLAHGLGGICVNAGFVIF